VPNGGKRHIAIARKLKIEGVKSGVPDITLIHEGRYYGIEVKNIKGRLSPNQKTMITLIQDNGGFVGVVRGVADTEVLLKEWGII
jgi:hypothetical protein